MEKIEHSINVATRGKTLILNDVAYELDVFKTQDLKLVTSVLNMFKALNVDLIEFSDSPGFIILLIEGLIESLENEAFKNKCLVLISSLTQKDLSKLQKLSNDDAIEILINIVKLNSDFFLGKFAGALKSAVMLGKTTLTAA